MEDVWKDISLNGLQEKPNGEDQGPKSNYRRMILQEFLARPFKEQQQATDVVVEPPELDIGLFSPLPAPVRPPETVLNSNSGSEFQYLDSIGFHPNVNSQSGNSSCFNSNADVSVLSSTSFDAIASSSSGLAPLGKKRIPELENNSTDRRHKRMIKNRESAARSRARKQAYTNELELEVAHLMEENAKLRKQQQQLCLAAAAAQLPTKHTLFRTSTAPF